MDVFILKVAGEDDAIFTNLTLAYRAMREAYESGREYDHLQLSAWQPGGAKGYEFVRSYDLEEVRAELFEDPDRCILVYEEDSKLAYIVTQNEGGEKPSHFDWDPLERFQSVEEAVAQARRDGIPVTHRAVFSRQDCF